MIKNFLKNMKINNLRKKIQRLQVDAVHHQRNGKLRHYAEIMAEIQELENKLLDLDDDED